MNFEQLAAMIDAYAQEGKDIQELRNDYTTLVAAGKTPLGLNQWVKSDKPVMEDFNEDNRILDEKLRELLARMAVAEEVPDEIPLSMVAGIVPHQGVNCTYSKNAHGLVQVHFCVSTEPYKDAIQSQMIASLPAGYRPASDIVTTCGGHYATTNASMPGILQALPDGQIYVQFPGTKMARAYGDVSFYAAQ